MSPDLTGTWQRARHSGAIPRMHAVLLRLEASIPTADNTSLFIGQTVRRRGLAVDPTVSFYLLLLQPFVYKASRFRLYSSKLSTRELGQYSGLLK